MSDTSVRTADRVRELNARATDAICVTLNDRIAYASRPTLRLFGMQRSDECLGRSLLEFFDPDIQPILRAGIRRLLEKKSESLLIDESTLIRSDRILVDVLLRVVRLDWHGEPAVQVTFGEIKNLANELRSTFLRDGANSCRIAGETVRNENFHR